jgi:hypothetical protein
LKKGKGSKNIISIQWSLVRYPGIENASEDILSSLSGKVPEAFNLRAGNGDISNP